MAAPASPPPPAQTSIAPGTPERNAASLMVVKQFMRSEGRLELLKCVADFLQNRLAGLENIGFTAADILAGAYSLQDMYRHGVFEGSGVLLEEFNYDPQGRYNNIAQVLQVYWPRLSRTATEEQRIRHEPLAFDMARNALLTHLLPLIQVKVTTTGGESCWNATYDADAGSDFDEIHELRLEYDATP